jgi:hypothetical protein
MEILKITNKYQKILRYGKFYQIFTSVSLSFAPKSPEGDFKNSHARRGWGQLFAFVP